MELYMNPADVAEIIGVDEDIIKHALARKMPEIEPFIRVVSGASDGESVKPEAILQLRIDGLSPLITQLSFNIPTNEIIENLICQIVHIGYLRESNEKLESETEKIKEYVQSLQEENSDLRVQINKLEEAARPRTWKERLFNIGE